MNPHCKSVYMFIGNDCLSAVAKRHKRASSVPPTTGQPGPCSLVKPQPRKINHAQQFYQSAHTIFSKIEQSIPEIKPTQDPIPSIPSIPSFATPSISRHQYQVPTTSPKPTTEEAKEDDTGNEVMIYKFIGKIFKLNVSESTASEMKQDAVAMIFQAYEQDEYKLHVLNLINYVNGQSTLSDLTKLRIITMDLNELLNQ